MSNFSWSDFETYLKPVHLKGEPHTVKIESIEIELVFNPGPKKKEKVPVMYFVGAQRGLVMSAAKRKALQAIFGDDSSAAIGKAITLVPGKNENGDPSILISPATNGHAEAA